MKRYGHLWEKFISNENIDYAIKRAVRSKKHKKNTKFFLKHQDELKQKLIDDLNNGRFKTSPYHIFKVFEPKEREIYELPLYPDHIVHHAIVNVLGPIWCKMFIRDSFACIPGRGLHAAGKRTMDFVRKRKYVLQCDIRKFYPSLDHDIMMKILSHKIKDKKLLNLMEVIIRSGGNGKNLPIGNLTSQWLGNVYMHELDIFVKSELRWHDYIRYCDDFCLFGDDKRELFRARNKISEFLGTNLGLALSRTRIYPVQNGVNFIGYRFFPRFILLRRRIKAKIRKRVNRILGAHDTSDFATGQMASVRGWLQWACSFNFRHDVLNTNWTQKTSQASNMVLKFFC